MLYEIDSPSANKKKPYYHGLYIYNELLETEDCNIDHGYFYINNRRYLGNKYKLLDFIERIVKEKCNSFNSFCDIFAGTGVVADRFNKKNNIIISNDILYSNYVCLKSFLAAAHDYNNQIKEMIQYLNTLEGEDNYFSEHFGGTYFTYDNAKIIGSIREEIEFLTENEDIKNILLCSLIYAVDKAANTVGHYDAYRKEMDVLKRVKLKAPKISFSNNYNNKVFKQDANELIKNIECDVLYIDPPYNSRQYSDAYHLIENLAEWKKPLVKGVAKKMDRSHIKSSYCLKNAVESLRDLISNAHCRHILISYNNTGSSKDQRSNARIKDYEIIDILKHKGPVEVFEKQYKEFSTGKSKCGKNIERIFYCEVK